MSFEVCLVHILNNEGGYSNHPKDPGKATNKGITQAKYDDYRKWKHLDNRDVREMEVIELHEIYESIWHAAHCDEAPTPLNLALFDTAVNWNPRQAIELLQEALVVGSDGIWGPQTFKAVTQAGGMKAAEALVSRRIDFRADRVRKRPDQIVFLKGWLRRDIRLERACRQLFETGKTR